MTEFQYSGSPNGTILSWYSLLHETDWMKTKMGIDPALDQARGLLDRVEKPDVQYGNPQQFTAGFIVLDDAKPELHGIERTGGEDFASNCLQVR